MIWSIADYCEGQMGIDLAMLDESSRQFLRALNLPSIHPFCDDPSSFAKEGVPPMGPLVQRFDDQNIFEAILTSWWMIAPPLLAMSELWLRLFAGALAPGGIVYLALQNLSPPKSSRRRPHDNKDSLKTSIIIFLTVASSSIVMTDTLYCHENGPVYGLILFVSAVTISLLTCIKRDLSSAALAVLGIVLLSIHLVWNDGEIVFGDKLDQVEVSEGLYYDQTNDFVSKIVSNWPESYREYDKSHGRTMWLPTGDSLTGIPFLINHLRNPSWERVFLEVEGDSSEDHEYVALDIAFPSGGHNFETPVYFVLHGLNGGSNEEYVRDLAIRRNNENSTVVVMVARGLMDLPIKG
jgi:hypothetical protein